MSDSKQLLTDYIENSSEAAFRELVGRYVDLVYSVALRRTDHDTRFAEDITQTVFIDLAAKARSLGANVMLGGWLHKHTCFVAANVLRAEKRRVIREREAMEASMDGTEPDDRWENLSPILDELIMELAPDDRTAVVLRFFEKKDFRSVGAALGVSDDTAQKRVSRSLERLRVLLGQRGLTMGMTALGVALADRSIQAAPAGLGSSIADQVVASGTISAVKRGPRLKWPALAGFVAALLLVCLHPDISRSVRLMLGDSSANAVGVTASSGVAAAENPESDPLSSGRNGDSGAVLGNDENANALDITNILQLTIVAADSDKPVPNVPVEVETTDQKDWERKKLISDRGGRLQVPIPVGLKELKITTQREGFADRRLSWNIDRGQVVPKDYLLRVLRPVRISGQVVDPQGKPVADAKVDFGHEVVPWLEDASVESSHFQWISVQTDGEGRWQINRIAPEMIGLLSGSAKHPAFSPSQDVDASADPEAGRQLVEGTHIFRLGGTFTIGGRVQDSRGNPVANARVLLGRSGFVDTRETRTDPDGVFEIAHARPGEELLTAEADGFAAATIPLEVSATSPKYTLTLQLGHTIRMRVVDVRGAPIPRATVIHALDQNRHPTNIVPQAEFTASTDESGRAVWANAPAKEVAFHVFAIGYMTANDVPLRVGEQEHVITLKPALSVSGTVEDAITGEMIPKFRMVCGWPHEDQPQWSSLSRHWVLFEGGKFQYSLEEPIVHGMANPGYMFKFDADGYEPFVSRVIAPTEATVQLPVKLKPAETPFVTVLSQEGKPIAFAEVGLVLPGANLEIEGARFAHGNNASPAARLRADVEGKFRLPADPALSHVAVVNPFGCAVVQAGELRETPYIRLQPWGRMEGTLRIDGKPAANKEFITKLRVGDTEEITYSFDKRLKSDVDGKVVFAALLPGMQTVTTFFAYTNGNTVSRRHIDLKEVIIQPGQTTVVDLGEEDNQNPGGGELKAD